MDFFKKIKNKLFGQTKNIDEKVSNTETLNVINNLIEDFNFKNKKINSRLSFVTEQLDIVQKRQDEILLNIEQILFTVSSSIDKDNTKTTVNEEKDLLAKVENFDKKLVKIKSTYDVN